MRVDPPGKLALGLGTGVAFGALLQRARVSDRHVIMDQLLLREHTVVKVMAAANVVGAAGVYALARRGKVKLAIKPLAPVALAAGGVLFGTGLAIFGYCPGTSLAAVGEGKGDALAGVLGMLAGAAIFIRAYPRLAPLLAKGNRGKVTLPAATRTRPWKWIAAMTAAVIGGGLAGHRLRLNRG